MTTHDCRGGGWTMKICNAIEAATAGDVLIVESEAASELAGRAVARMRPDLQVTIRAERAEAGR